MIGLSASSNIDSYINYLRHEKRYSQHTLSSYKNDLDQFQFFVRKTYPDASLSEITHNHIRSWMVELINNNITSKSINRKISSLRSYYNYLLKQEIVAKNPTIKIITPKIPKRLPEFIQEKNIAQLFDNLIEGDFEEFRDRLIIELFYITGMRKIELINLSDDDIDISNNVVKVLGKGNKERLCPLLESILSKINRYKELRDSFFEGDLHSKHLFVTSKGAKMYPKFVYNLVKSYLSTITTSNKRSPHILRHSFATHLMNGGADLNAVKELLGHANLAATQIYTHNSIEKLKEVYKNAHPKSENK